MPEIRKSRFASRWTLTRRMEEAAARLSWAVRRWQARRTVAALEMLSDALLRDIGVTRAEIPALALRVTAPRSTETHLSERRTSTIGKEISACLVT